MALEFWRFKDLGFRGLGFYLEVKDNQENRPQFYDVQHVIS